MRRRLSSVFQACYRSRPVRSSEEGNRVRWRGEPGFFEIWFLVVFDPEAPRAWWLRYTTFSPAPGRPGPPRATIWAAAFDARAPVPARAGKRILPLDAYRAHGDGPFRVRLADAEITNASAAGACTVGGRPLAWDLRFTPAVHEAVRAPALLHRASLPTHVSHANDGVLVDGWVALDGVRVVLAGAPAVQKHIWGTRRVEELAWLYCPRFAGDSDARLEATWARVRRTSGPPALTTLWAETADGVHDRCGLSALALNGLERLGPTRLRWRSSGPRRRVVVTAWCEPATLAGWVYRDPSGFDLHIAQSDVASCTLELETRAHPLARWRSVGRLECVEGAALEFHAPEPLPGVAYIAWDEEEVREACRRSS
jgi:hypothetical protein